MSWASRGRPTVFCRNAETDTDHPSIYTEIILAFGQADTVPKQPKMADIAGIMKSKGHSVDHTMKSMSLKEDGYLTFDVMPR